MAIINFPKISTPYIRRLGNYIRYSKKLSPVEEKYANILTKELRENINPWDMGNSAHSIIIQEIRDEFKKQVQDDIPKRNKGIIRNVENYVFKIANHHFGIMNKAENQKLIQNAEDITAQIGHFSSEANALMTEIEKLNIKYLDGKISKNKYKESFNNLKKQLLKVSEKHDKLCDKHKNIMALNEANARSKGIYDSYDYVYNMP